MLLLLMESILATAVFLITCKIGIAVPTLFVLHAAEALVVVSLNGKELLVVIGAKELTIIDGECLWPMWKVGVGKG